MQVHGAVSHASRVSCVRRGGGRARRPAVPPAFVSARAEGAGGISGLFGALASAERKALLRLRVALSDPELYVDAAMALAAWVAAADGHVTSAERQAIARMIHEEEHLRDVFPSSERYNELAVGGRFDYFLDRIASQVHTVDTMPGFPGADVVDALKDFSACEPREEVRLHILLLGVELGRQNSQHHLHADEVVAILEAVDLLRLDPGKFDADLQAEMLGED